MEPMNLPLNAGDSGAGATAPTAPLTSSPATTPTAAPAMALRLAAGASALAGVLHYAAVPEHRAEWWAAAVFFTYKFPKATIIALEPDSAKYELLIANTAGLPVQCIQATVASEGAVDRAAPRVAVGDIYDRSPDTQPFILKFDIEADDLFALNTEWLQRTPALIASLSDYLVPGTAASRRFIKYTTGWDRDLIYAEDNLFSLGRTPMRAAA